MLGFLAATFWNTMKQWTKENMRLLSKWRAKKREVASKLAPDLIDPEGGDLRRTITPRELASVREAETPVVDEEKELDEPYLSRIACCNADPASSEGAAGDPADAGGDMENNVGSQKAAGGGDCYPFDENPKRPGKSAGRRHPQQQHQRQHQQQQLPLHKELFFFFLRRSWKKKLFSFLALCMIIPVILDAFILRTGRVTEFIDDFLEWMADNPLLGVWAYVSMLVVTSLVFVPPSVLIFAAGFTFKSIWGPFHGMLIALVASFLGSALGGLVGFWRAKYMTRDLIEVLMRRYPLFRAVDAAVVRNSFRVMVLMRLNCLIPFGVLNYVFGITGVEWAAFVLAMVGVLPWQFLLIFLGASANSIYDEEAETTLAGVILIGTGIAFCIIGLAITWKFAKIELQKEVDAAPPTTANDYRLSEEGKLYQLPWKSSFRSVPDRRSSTAAASIEAADPYYATDYFLMHALGMEVSPVEYGVDEQYDVNYQANLGWNEIILDDFS